MASDELRQEIDRLEQELATLEAAESDAASEVTMLTEELHEYEGRLALTRGALADYRQRLADRRAAMDGAIAAEARDAFEDALQRREQAAASVAEAVNVVLEREDDFERSSEVTRAAWTTWAGHDPKLAAERADAVDARPQILDEAWDRLSAKVRERLDEQLERDLVEAAALSPLGHAISDLPPHLQELARQKRRSGVGARTPNHNPS
jgi:predicted  nucleic acid-binding Zn-ribbon protein